MIFPVEGMPQGKSRARTVRNKYTGKVHSFTPEKTAKYEEQIRRAFKRWGGTSYGDKMLDVEIAAYFPIPKSYSKKNSTDALLGIMRPTKKPDCDNIIKVVLDALNGVAYDDDKQVVCVSCNKYYAMDEDDGFITIEINEAETAKENEE